MLAMSEIQHTNSVISNQKLNVTLSPNPSNGTIKLRSDKTFIIESIKVINSLGAMISEFKDRDFSSLISNEYSLNLSNITAGVYFIQLYTDKGVYNFELILN